MLMIAKMSAQCPFMSSALGYVVHGVAGTAMWSSFEFTRARPPDVARRVSNCPDVGGACASLARCVIGVIGPLGRRVGALHHRAPWVCCASANWTYSGSIWGQVPLLERLCCPVLDPRFAAVGAVCRPRCAAEQESPQDLLLHKMRLCKEAGLLQVTAEMRVLKWSPSRVRVSCSAP
jgi:hypothetical protein